MIGQESIIYQLLEFHMMMYWSVKVTPSYYHLGKSLSNYLFQSFEVSANSIGKIIVLILSVPVFHSVNPKNGNQPKLQ